MFDRHNSSIPRIYLGLMALVTGLFLTLSVEAQEESKKATVEGAVLSYGKLETPSEGWGTEQEQSWFEGKVGKIKTEFPLAYGKGMLPPGHYDVWLEKGKGGWFYMIIGEKPKSNPKSDDEKPTMLRARFKLYPKQEGVTERRFELKLTNRSSKLKFSILAGRSEGHGNFRIVKEEKEDLPG